MIVALGGCMSQEEGVVKTIQDKYKWLNIVFGTHNIYDLPYLIEKSLKDPTQQIEVLTKQEKIVENIPVKRDSKYQAYVNIIYGCDKFCTYCIVPFTRGKELSRKEEDILEEIKKLKDAIEKERMTLIPLKLYFVKNKVKILIGVCRGKKNYDKRESLKEKDMKRNLEKRGKYEY